MKIYWPELFNYLFLIFTMLEIGILVNWHETKEFLKDRGFFLRVLMVNLVLIPLLGLLIVWLFQFKGEFAVGILLLASAPGGLAAMRYTKNIPGKLAFATIVEFSLTLSALLVSPFLIALLFPGELKLKWKTLELISWFILLIGLPLLSGIAIRRRVPFLVKKLANPFLQLSNLFFLLIAFTSAGIKNTAFKQMGWEMLLALVLLIFAAMFIGWLFGGRDNWHRRILAVATSIRNVGLCLLVAHHNFAHTNVDMVVIAYMGLMIPIVGFFMTFHHYREKLAHKKPA